MIEHVELKSDQMDSNQIDELLKRLSDVTLNGTDTRWACNEPEFEL